MLSNRDKRIYEQILAQINKERAKDCTNKFYSEQLDVSQRKFSDFINLKLYDMELLIQYAAINDYVFYFSIRRKVSIFDGSF